MLGVVDSFRSALVFNVLCFLFFFFFQAEDGIRDIGVTGVQTCALPIYIIVKAGKLFRNPLDCFFIEKVNRISLPKGQPFRKARDIHAQTIHTQILLTEKHLA